METSRRSFLKFGTLGVLLLAAGGGAYRLLHGAPAARFALDKGARAAIDAMVPALLAGALPLEPAARQAAIGATTRGVHQAILGLPLGAQKELQDLFGMLALGPVRRLLGALPSDWPEASPEQVGAFLQGWRTHRIGMLRAAYQALHDLVIGAWYAEPTSWPAIGYPGPMKELSA
ncbi:MAG: twin-arginine translocation signal domain-containing protein [Pseudomonadota bacterium]